MEDIVAEKGIEKSQPEPQPEPVISEVKARKPRTEAQKAAFEKARKKRAENLAKKKAQEEIDYDSDTEAEEKPKPAPKKRGRPKGSRSKKLTRETVPELGTYLPQNIPPEAGDIRYGYGQPPQQHQFAPWMYAQQPQPQQAPQVHNYYYGHQQGAVNQAPQQQGQEEQPQPLSPDPQLYNEAESSSEESEDERDYLPAPEDPRLKFRFG